jgi:hypothetical protein
MIAPGSMRNLRNDLNMNMPKMEIKKSFNDWWEVGRVVKRGEKGIREDEQIVFAESQTRRVPKRQPCENTFNGWIALGRRVKRGERGRRVYIKLRTGADRQSFKQFDIDGFLPARIMEMLPKREI